MANQTMDKLRESFHAYCKSINPKHHETDDSVQLRKDFALYQAAYAQAISEFEQVAFVTKSTASYFNKAKNDDCGVLLYTKRSDCNIPLYTRKDNCELDDKFNKGKEE